MNMQKEHAANMPLDYALQYISLGWHLVVMNVGTKGPTTSGWNMPSELVNTPERAERKFANGPMNIGVVHQPSGTVALDVDDEAWTRVIFDEFGLDYDSILASGMRIISKEGRAKALFKAPAGLKLHKINWPKPDAKTPMDVMTIVEFRSGPNQDVLPPSLHPDGHHYTWADGQSPWDFKDGLPEIPKSLLEFWTLYEESSSLRDEVKALCPWAKKHDVLAPKSMHRQVSAEHGNVIGKFNAAYSIESLLTDAGYRRKGKRWLAPSSSTRIPGVVIFKDQATPKCYSHHGSDVLADKFAHDAFDVFMLTQYGGNFQSALESAASMLGVVRGPAHLPDIEIDAEAMFSAQAARKAQKLEEKPLPVVQEEKHQDVKPIFSQEIKLIDSAAQDADEIPQELLTPPGFVGDAMRWVLSCAQKPEPLLALGAALSMASTALANKVEGPTGLRTNLYLVLCAPSSAGKDHGRKCNKMLAAAAGISDQLGGEEIASGAALLARVAKTPGVLFQPDEFGLWMKSVNAVNAASHQRQIIEGLMKLFTSAGQVVVGVEYADQKSRPRVDIEYPCVNVYATTVPDPLFEALSGAEIVNGFMNRLMILFVDKKDHKFSMQRVTPPPQELVDWVKAARSMTAGQIGGGVPSDPITLGVTDDAMALMEANYYFQQEQENKAKEFGCEALWGRFLEHTWKVASVVACAKYSKATDLMDVAADSSLVIDRASAEWATTFTKYVFGRMQKEVVGRVADSPFGRIVKSVAERIREAGLAGLTSRELGRVCRAYRGLEPRMRDSVIEALKRDEELFIVTFKSGAAGGRHRIAYVHTDYEHVLKKDAETSAEVPSPLFETSPEGDDE